MKRSFLKELGLESEVIDKIMAENGKDIQKYKTEIEDYIEEIKELKSANIDKENSLKAKENELRKEFEVSIEKAKKYDDAIKENEELKESIFNREFSDATDVLFKENEIEFTSNMSRDTTISKLKEKNFKIVDGKFGEDAVNFLNELKESDTGAFKDLIPENTGGPGNFPRNNNLGDIGFKFNFTGVR